MARVLCVGHAVEDHIFRVRDIPTTATKHRATGFEVVGGGPAANASVAIARLGGSVFLCARVGDDAIGTSIIQDLEEEGVDCRYVGRLEGHKSSLSSVLIADDGQRMIVNYLDPSMPAMPNWLADAQLPDVDALLVDVRWPAGAEHCLMEARKRGIPGIVDADIPVPEDGRLLMAASHVAFSADGLRSYSGQDDLKSALKRISGDIDGWCCVTDGENGTLIADRAGFISVPAYDVDTVDTLGAGDVWHGVFALCLAEGQSELDAVRVANAAAALKVTRPGGRKGAPYRSDLDAFMDAHDVREERG